MLSHKDLETITNIADSAQYRLSCWMDEQILEELNKKLLHSDLHRTWQKLIESVNDVDSLHDFYITVLDSWYRYKSVSKLNTNMSIL